MKIIEKIEIEHDIYYIRCMNEKYSTIKRVRLKEIDKDAMDGFKKCLKCGYKFKDDDIPWIAFNKKNTNRFFCEKCAREFKENER